MAEVMKFADFKAEGSEAAVKVRYLSFIFEYYSNYSDLHTVGGGQIPATRSGVRCGGRRHNFVQVQRRCRSAGQEKIGSTNATQPNFLLLVEF